PITCQIGRSRPKGKATTPTTAQGITTTETSGRASALPMSPKGCRLEVVSPEGRGREGRDDRRDNDAERRAHAPGHRFAEKPRRLRRAAPVALPFGRGDERRDGAVGHLEARAEQR